MGSSPRTDPVDVVHGRYNGQTLLGTFGRNLHSSFVVPLPTTDGLRFWNMTQAVQECNQVFITREAWIASMQRCPVTIDNFPNFREEMRCATLKRHGRMDSTTAASPIIRWPLYYSVAFPVDAPSDWQGIATSRLMPTLLRQLFVSGFSPRPLCCDRPHFLILIWSNDALWSNKSLQDIARPLDKRLHPSIYASLLDAYQALRMSRVFHPYGLRIIPNEILPPKPNK
jgi:hypothetical protein